MEEVAARIGRGDVQETEASYFALRGLTRWGYEGWMADAYFRDDRLLLVVAAPVEMLEEDLPLPQIETFQARFGPAELRLRSHTDRHHLIHVFLDHGLSAAADVRNGEIHLFEYFPPMTAFDYCYQIYNRPPTFSL